MARKKSPPKKPAAAPKEHYEYVKATIEADPDDADDEEADAGTDSLSWEYKLPGKPKGSMAHDEDVAGWTDDQVRELTRNMLEIDAADPVTIEIVRN